MDIRKKFFTLRIVKHWSRLSREVVDVPSLEALKVRLDGALGNLIYLWFYELLSLFPFCIADLNSYYE